jgi:hypothetical protein
MMRGDTAPIPAEKTIADAYTYLLGRMLVIRQEHMDRKDDVDTRALILNEQKIADRSSRMDLRRNDDGSVDIYCGPKAPAGFEIGSRPCPAGIGSHISGSTSRPRRTSIGPGHCRTSSRSRTPHTPHPSGAVRN